MYHRGEVKQDPNKSSTKSGLMDGRKMGDEVSIAASTQTLFIGVHLHAIVSGCCLKKTNIQL